MLVLASVTESLANFATDLIDKIGLAGVFILMTLESACIPIPSEVTMLFTGFNVARGHYSLIVATLVGTTANLVGSWIAYGVGYFGRIELIERHGGKLHISPKHLATADRWFAERGEITVFLTRMMPIIRTFISLPAGVARMNFLRFSVFTFLGSIPWVFGLTLVGKEAGANWEDWKNRLHYVDYAFAALIVAAIAYYGVRWWKRRRGGGGPGEPAERAPEPAADVTA